MLNFASPEKMTWLSKFVYLSSFKLSGEVSDSESNSSSSSSDSDSSEDEVFRDGYDDDLMGDAEDRARLEQMTEKEREQELFNRIEKREVLKRRSVTLLSSLHVFSLYSEGEGLHWGLLPI